MTLICKLLSGHSQTQKTTLVKSARTDKSRYSGETLWKDHKFAPEMFLEEKKASRHWCLYIFDFSVFSFGWFWFERTNTEIAIKRFLPIRLSRPRGTKKKLAVVEFEIRIGRERDKNSKQHVFLENILTRLIIQQSTLNHNLNWPRKR